MTDAARHPRPVRTAPFRSDASPYDRPFAILVRSRGERTRVVRNEVGTEVYTAHRLDYGKNGEVVLYVMGESWEWDGEAENCPTDYAVSYAREFRYDNAMQRYMNVELDPTDDFEPIETVWTDYDGDRVYGDFKVVDDEYLEVMSHEPGIGFVATPTASPFIFYYHGDMLGTTRRTTNGPGNMVDTAAYTAFGEFLGGSADRRYGFAGAWQYQSHPGTGFPFLHVGHRYYDPATGRFLQRDPIGIGGGFNVYAYVGGRPTLRVDPSGLQDPGCDIRSNFWAKCYLEGDFEKGDDIVEAQAAGCAIGAAGVLLCVGGARAAPVVWGAARSGLRGALRWGNRGFFRVGRSVPPGKGPVCSIRWGEKHLDLFKLPKWLDDLYK